MSDLQFPTDIAYGSEGGPEYSTDLVVVVSGYEARNENWAEPHYRFEAATGIAKEEDLYVLLKFFHACGGRAQAFRFKDWSDYKSCSPEDTISATDVTLESDATAGQSTVQLIKTYVSGSYTRQRTIYKPVTGTTVLKVNGVARTTGFSVSLTTGVVTFSPVLNLHDVVTGGFHFDIWARFDTDRLSRRFQSYLVGEASVPIVGVKI